MLELPEEVQPVIWPHHIPTMPPAPHTENHPPIEPISLCDQLQSVGPELPRQGAPRHLPDRVGAWMQQPVVTCLPQQNLGELMELLSVHNISGAPVVDEEGALLGVVSQTDVAAYLGGIYGEQTRSGHGYHQGRLAYFNPIDPQIDPTLRRSTVADILSTTVHCVSPQASLHQVIELMLREHVHRLPVLEDGRLVGLISTLDVLRILRDRHMA